MIIAHQNILYRLGWSHAKVIAAQDILDHGTPSQVNKLMTETAPQIRAIWHLAA